jgi:hypothetical protein
MSALRVASIRLLNQNLGFFSLFFSYARWLQQTNYHKKRKKEAREGERNYRTLKVKTKKTERRYSDI